MTESPPGPPPGDLARLRAAAEPIIAVYRQPIERLMLWLSPRLGWLPAWFRREDPPIRWLGSHWLVWLFLGLYLALGLWIFVLWLLVEVL